MIRRSNNFVKILSEKELEEELEEERIGRQKRRAINRGYIRHCKEFKNKWQKPLFDHLKPRLYTDKTTFVHDSNHFFTVQKPHFHSEKPLFDMGFFQTCYIVDKKSAVEIGSDYLHKDMI